MLTSVKINEKPSKQIAFGTKLSGGIGMLEHLENNHVNIPVIEEFKDYIANKHPNRFIAHLYRYSSDSVRCDSFGLQIFEKPLFREERVVVGRQIIHDVDKPATLLANLKSTYDSMMYSHPPAVLARIKGLFSNKLY